MVDSVINALEKESKEVFERVDVESGNYGISYEPILVKGNNVASIIIEYADQHDAEVIIMGSRGNGKIKTAIMGSVAHNVFHNTKKPMLIIK